MTEQEYIRRAESLKEQLYRCAAVYLGSPSDAVDAVDEAFYNYRPPAFPNSSALWGGACTSSRYRSLPHL